MKLKTAILLCLLVFASMTTTVAICLNASKPDLNGLFDKAILDSDPIPPGPLSGDPVGGGGGPH